MTFKTITFLIIITLFNVSFSLSQNDSLKSKSPVVFGSIYPGFVSTFSMKDKPNYGFEMNTALVGFKTDFADKATAILIYDVTKTTGDIVVRDSNNTLQSVSFFKGSDYTAFLKQAEINWKPKKNIELALGQLLNEQYLTVQDKFWGYRYVAYTFQERYKFGNQADFGLRAALVNNNWRISTTISNGEGPLYKQDSEGRLMYALNAEYRPSKNFIFKVYGDIYPGNKMNRECLSAFMAYGTDKYRIGIEGCLIENDKWIEKYDYWGYSGFISYKIAEKWNVFIREDYLDKSYLYDNKTSISFAGVQYEPVKNFNIALNYRFIKEKSMEYHQVALNVGIKF